MRAKPQQVSFACDSSSSSRQLALVGVSLRQFAPAVKFAPEAGAGRHARQDAAGLFLHELVGLFCMR